VLVEPRLEVGNGPQVRRVAVRRVAGACRSMRLMPRLSLFWGRPKKPGLTPEEVRALREFDVVLN
jgi:hypothetical protein